MGAISPSSSFLLVPLSPTNARHRHCYLLPTTSLSKTLNPSLHLGLRQTTPIRCSSSNSGSPGSGDSDSKAVLDAFFLGKAFAEALNERIESTVGEFLSVVGQWQAEKRKEVMDFQEEVAERAKRAKEKAAFEAMEAQGHTFRSVSPSKASTSAQTYPSNETNDPFQEMFKDS